LKYGGFTSVFNRVTSCRPKREKGARWKRGKKVCLQRFVNRRGRPKGGHHSNPYLTGATVGQGDEVPLVRVVKGGKWERGGKKMNSGGLTVVSIEEGHGRKKVGGGTIHFV